MKAGDSITLWVGRQNPLGSPATGRQVTDFIVSCDGVVIAPSALTFTEVGTASGSQWDTYSFQVTDPSAAGTRLYVVECALSGYQTDVILNGIWSGPMDAYDDTAVAALLLTQQGIPAVQSAADASLGSIVDGNSYMSPVLTMPAGMLSPFSITNIAASGIVVSAAIMATPATTSFPITCTVISGPALQFQFGWTTQQHPALAGTNSQATWYIDVGLVKASSSLIITPNRYTFTQVWKRGTVI